MLSLTLRPKALIGRYYKIFEKSKINNKTEYSPAYSYVEQATEQLYA